MKSLAVCLLLLGACGVHSSSKMMMRSAVEDRTLLESCFNQTINQKVSKKENSACFINCIAEKTEFTAQNLTANDITKFLFGPGLIKPSVLEDIKLKCDFTKKVDKCAIGFKLLHCLDAIKLKY